MNKKKRLTRKPSEEQWKRLLEAQQDFHKMQKEILPFVKRRRFKQYSTAGKWRETSSLYSQRGRAATKKIAHGIELSRKRFS